jgi:hypothetical protein
MSQRDTAQLRISFRAWGIAEGGGREKTVEQHDDDLPIRVQLDGHEHRLTPLEAAWLVQALDTALDNAPHLVPGRQRIYSRARD